MVGLPPPPPGQHRPPANEGAAKSQQDRLAREAARRAVEQATRNKGQPKTSGKK